MGNNENFVYIIRDVQLISGVFSDRDAACRYFANLIENDGLLKRFAKDFLKNFVKWFVERPKNDFFSIYHLSIKKYPIKDYPGIIDV